ncbi:MAG: hypothetical protein RR580_07720 [Christensenellaceae bacterium]
MIDFDDVEIKNIGDIGMKILINCHNQNRPTQKDYQKNGVWYCSKCGTKKQANVEIAGQKVTMFCACECEAREARKLVERMKGK